MTEDTADQRLVDSLPEVSRRSYLRAAGAVAGSSVLINPASAASGDTSPSTETDREDFRWTPIYVFDDPGEQKKYENVLAYAKRHDLSLAFSAPSTLPETATRIEPLLQKADDYGVQGWLATGSFRDDFTAPQLVNDPQARETFLDRLRQITEVYANYYPDGKMIMWHEAPLVSNWDPNGGWTYTAVRNLRDLGPSIFAGQRETIKDVSTDIDAGIFPHFPYVKPGGGFAHIFEKIMDQLKRMDALVDFTFTDFYRGYVEPGSGQEGANDYLRSMMQNATEQTDGRPVYNLAEDHTINNGYTPSKESMRMNLQAALDGGADGIGWYSRVNYKYTNDSLTPNDPFLPNVGDIKDPSPHIATTLTWARDRYQYGYVNTFASRDGFDPSGVFDLWIYGHDMDFYEHRLSLKTVEGDWEFIGDFNGYLSQEFPYTGDGTDHVSIFHALDRDRYLGKRNGHGKHNGHGKGHSDGKGDHGHGKGKNNKLHVRIETDEDSDGSELRTIYAMPFSVDNYLPEPDAPDLLEQSATQLVHENQNLNGVSYGHARLNTTVSAGDVTYATLPSMSHGHRPLETLLDSHHHD